MQKLLKAREVHKKFNMGETILERAIDWIKWGLTRLMRGIPHPSPSNEALTRDGLDTSVIS